MADHPFIIPLTKIDVERRLVIGLAAEEVVDKAKEIMDYASARPQFEEWSDSFKQASNGMSKGNLRSMHTKTVAGKFDDISYNDETKQIHVVAKVIDEGEWQKCLQGAYTGFSIGGGYLKKWVDPSDPKLTRYTPIIREISLVDSPCMPTARFAELVKADGVVEQIELHGAPPSTFAQAWADRPVLFADAWADRPQTFAELAKAAFDESKHKRKGGKFASEGLVGRNTAIRGSAYVGGALGAAAAVGAHAAVQGARYGFGQKGKRNAIASSLRGSAEGRKSIVAVAHSERNQAASLFAHGIRGMSDKHRGTLDLPPIKGRARLADAANTARGLRIGGRAAQNSIKSMVMNVRPAGRPFNQALLIGGAALGAIGGVVAAHKAMK